MINTDIFIIGAGASGLMCREELLNEGNKLFYLNPETGLAAE